VKKQALKHSSIFTDIIQLPPLIGILQGRLLIAARLDKKLRENENKRKYNEGAPMPIAAPSFYFA